MKTTISTNSFENSRFEIRYCLGFRYSNFGFKKTFAPSCLRGKGFTLVEVVVAIGIMVMVVAFSGVIFQRSIGSYRAATAQAEIMTKLRVITEQLDSDFRGLRKDAPMFIYFAKGTDTKYDVTNRFDQIMFFADGDFQSTQTFNSQTVVGNVARIYYGHAFSIDQSDKIFKKPDSLPPKNRLLARRQHILTADTTTFPPWYDFSNFTTIPFNAKDNNNCEYDTNSVSQWQATMQNSTDANLVAVVCFENRPVINIAEPNSLHNLMTDGIGSFSIQWDYITTLGEHYWWPALDPDGNPATSDSDFDAMVSVYSLSLPQFGIYFNSASPGGSWSRPEDAQYTHPPTTKPAYPKALKFVFVIYDSKGVFPNGQTFSHIVYLGD